MNKVPLIIIAIFGCLIISGVQSVSAQNWPQWRGPLATGAAISGDPPIEWSEQKNVRWKIRLSGTGKSTPAVWGNYIFVTATKTTENDVVKSGIATATEPVKFLVIAVDRETGEVFTATLSRASLFGKKISAIWIQGETCSRGLHQSFPKR